LFGNAWQIQVKLSLWIKHILNLSGNGFAHLKSFQYLFYLIFLICFVLFLRIVSSIIPSMKTGDLRTLAQLLLGPRGAAMQCSRTPAGPAIRGSRTYNVGPPSYKLVCKPHYMNIIKHIAIGCINQVSYRLGAPLYMFVGLVSPVRLNWR